MQRIAVIAGVLHSGGKRNLIMEYYRHIDRTKVNLTLFVTLILMVSPRRKLGLWEDECIK